MNKLSLDRRAAIVRALVDGASIRSIARMMRCDKDTVSRVLVEVGEFCSMYQDFVLTNLSSVKRVEADEIWSYVGAKEANKTRDGQGDCWTFTALCADSKLAITWLVGSRSLESTHAFISDLADRLPNRVQLSTDGFMAYRSAVAAAWDWRGQGVDFGTIKKTFATPLAEALGRTPGRYSPSTTVIEVEKVAVFGRRRLSDHSR